MATIGMPSYLGRPEWGQRREGFFVGKTGITVERGYGKCSPSTLCRWKQRLASYTDKAKMKCLALH